jgi:3-hydroxyacyl-CoA dehydrogenase
MLHADTVGLAAVVQAMKGYRAATGDDFWEPAPLLARLAVEGRSFNEGK